MNRRDFLKRAMQGAAIATTAPLLVIKALARTKRVAPLPKCCGGLSIGTEAPDTPLTVENLRKAINAMKDACQKDGVTTEQLFTPGYNRWLTDKFWEKDWHDIA